MWLPAENKIILKSLRNTVLLVVKLGNKMILSSLIHFHIGLRLVNVRLIATDMMTRASGQNVGKIIFVKKLVQQDPFNI